MSKSECPKEIGGLASSQDLSLWRKLDKNLHVPFVHKFQTKSNKYIYDVNTSHILCVAPIVWDIMDDFGRRAKDEIISKYKSSYEANEVLSAYNVIEDAQNKHGFLLPNRPKYIVMPYDKAEIQKKLMSERSHLILGVTEACNFRCSYCVFSGKYAGWRHHSNQMMDWKVAHKAIDEFLAHSGDSKDVTISFYGGEPLLNISLIRKCVSYIRERISDRDVGFALTTNGFLLKGDMAKFLATEKFAFRVSLDGPKHIHDQRRSLKDGTGTWEHIIANIKKFLQEYPEYKTNGLMGFNTVVTPPINMTELENFFSDCDCLTDDIGLSVNWILTQGSSYIESLAPEDRRVGDIDTLYEKYLVNLENGKINDNFKSIPFKVQAGIFQRSFLDIYKRGYNPPDQNLLPKYFCPLPTCVPGIPRLFVASDGNYYTCERCTPVELMRIGNVQEGVNVSRVQHLLEEFVDLSKDECRFCWCLPTCVSACHVTCMVNGQFSRDEKHRACASHRSVTHRTMRDMCRVLEKNSHAFDFLEKITLS